MARKRLDTLEKIQLMFWKNWHIHFFHRKQIIFCIAAPLLFILILVALRFIMEVEHVATQKYEVIPLDGIWSKTVAELQKRYVLKPVQYSCFIPRIAIAYGPNGTDYVNEIMAKAAADYLDNVQLYSFKTYDEVMEAMKTQHYIAGVFFPYSETNYISPISNKAYPRELFHTFVFPNELRFYSDSFIGAGWQTSLIYDQYHYKKQRNAIVNDDGSVGYIREGFTSLQNAIALSFIKLCNSSVTLPSIRLHRFPDASYTTDPMAEGLMFSLSFIIIVGFWFPCVCLMVFINTEKRTERMKFIKVMGVGYEIQIISWLINAFVILFVSSILVICAIKIRFANGFALCTKSYWSTLFIIIIIYAIGSLSFSFMTCSFFDNRLTSMVFLGLIWMLTYMPFMLLHDSSRTALKLVACILPNTALGIMFFRVVDLEEFEEGLTWNSIFAPKIEDTVPVGVVVMLQLGACISYILIGMQSYRSHIYLTALRTRVQRKFQARRSRLSTDYTPLSRRSTRVSEISPEPTQLSVEVIRLSLNINDKPVIKNVTMNLNENEITVIMGANGSGKSQLLSLINGFNRASHGTVVIYGYDIRKEPDDAYAYVASSFKNTNLIPELTVFDQAQFHCRLKGLQGEDQFREIDKYLSESNLSEKTNLVTANLCLSTRKYLSVCCALIGQSTFVILDQPTNGMEPMTRKRLWDLLVNEKLARTILITTHSMEESDCVADRVGFMSGGELKYFGSSFFLRNIYASGNRLIIIKDEDCDTENVTEVMQQYIPDITPESDIGAELSYRLDDKYKRVFSKMLLELEQRSIELKINSMMMREATLDDIFMGIGNNAMNEKLRFSQTNSRRTKEYDDKNNFMYLERCEKYTGLLLLFSQFQAIFYKRFMISLHFKTITMQIIFMPVIFTAISLLFPATTRKHSDPPMIYDLVEYPESVTVLSVQKNTIDEFLENVVRRYKHRISLKGLDHKIALPVNKLFSEYILDVQTRDSDSYYQYLIGISVQSNGLTAWFNNLALHSIPISLNLLHKAILCAAVNKNTHLIAVTNAPLPYEANYHTDDIRAPVTIGSNLATNLTYCFSLVWVVSATYLVKERRNRYTLLQQTCGVRTTILWLTYYFYDCLCVLISTCFIMITVLAFRNLNYMQADMTMYFYPTIMLFGMVTVPFYYIVSHLFNDFVLAFLVISAFNFYGGLTFITFTSFLDHGGKQYKPVMDKLIGFFRLFPHFSLCNTLLKIFKIGQLRRLCADENVYRISVHLEKCKVTPNCCINTNELTWTDVGILPEVTALLAFGIFCTIILLLLEAYKKNRNFLGRKIPRDDINHARDDYIRWHEEDTRIDESVYKEMMCVNNLKHHEYQSKPLVLKAFGKIYKNVTSAQRMFLIINRFECVCFISMENMENLERRSPIKALVGEDKVTYGRAYINGISLTEDLQRAYPHLGYCPQIDILEKKFSAAEHMLVLARLRGIPTNKIAPICEGLARILGFINQYTEPMSQLSRGHLRRVSIAGSMLGNPSIIFLDEPTVSLDIVSQRNVWNLIAKTRKTGTAVLLTSINTHECERISGRIAVICRGRLQVIVHPDDLYDKWSTGYLLQIKVKAPEMLDEDDSEIESRHTYFTTNPYIKIQAFVETQFQNARIREQRGHLLYFLIPLKDTKLSHIYSLIERNSFNLNIETFSVTTSSLSAILMDLTERENRDRISKLILLTST